MANERQGICWAFEQPLLPKSSPPRQDIEATFDEPEVGLDGSDGDSEERGRRAECLIMSCCCSCWDIRT